LSPVKEKIKKVKGAVKRKIFNLTDFSGSDSSGKGEMTVQLNEKFHTNRKKRVKSGISGSRGGEYEGGCLLGCFAV
jgi:uncharacterized protein YjbJ (UPF0337 family)